MRMVTVAMAENEEHRDRLVRAEQERAAAHTPRSDVSVSEIPAGGPSADWPRFVTFRRRAVARPAGVIPHPSQPR